MKIKIPVTPIQEIIGQKLYYEVEDYEISDDIIIFNKGE